MVTAAAALPKMPLTPDGRTPIPKDGAMQPGDAGLRAF
jgi:hypothetical protein